MINVLRLNARYEPLSIVPLKRAMSLWVRGRVDGVSEDAVEVRAAESGVCACEPRNGRKGDRLPHEAGMKLLWRPKIPRVDYLVAAGEVPDSWKIYLEV